MITRTLNLMTGEEKKYTQPPKDAVVCAYAQEHGDFNTFEYDEKYNHKVQETKRCVFCGDWGAVK